MKDIKLNRYFEIVIDHRNDLATVEGRDEFEQHLALGVTQFFTEEIGSVDHRSAKSRLRLYANRLANQSDRAGEVASVSVEEHEYLSNTLEVSIVYQNGAIFSFDVN